jgi:hypothetical protein
MELLILVPVVCVTSMYFIYFVNIIRAFYECEGARVATSTQGHRLPSRGFVPKGPVK